MSFPDEKFGSVMAYADAYFDALAAAHASVDARLLDKALTVLQAAYARGATIFTCGNGGSATVANQLVCAHSKNAELDTELKPKVVSLVTNIEILTAIANDVGYDEIFVSQLATLAEPGDVLITISASGDSENVVRAAEWAQAIGIEIIALTGFDGGRTAKLATVNLHVKGDNYGVVTDTHQSLMHILAQFIRQDYMSEDLVKERMF